MWKEYDAARTKLYSLVKCRLPSIMIIEDTVRKNTMLKSMLCFKSFKRLQWSTEARTAMRSRSKTLGPPLVLVIRQDISKKFLQKTQAISILSTLLGGACDRVERQSS
ncbi:hypothetical protein RJZ57_003614 [Blastomyces gilchristii]